MEESSVTAIVIADDHYNGLGIIRSLGEEGVPVYLVLLKDTGKTIIDKSKYVTKTLKVKKDRKAILDAIEVCIAEQGRFAIIPLCDFAAEVVDDCHTAFSENIAVPNANGNLHDLMNKYRLAELFRTAGIQVPIHREVIMNEDNVWDKFPAIIKPLASVEGQKNDITTVRNKEELQDSFVALRKKGYKRALVEEFIDGADSFMVEVLGYVDKMGEPHFSSVIHKVREYPIKNGSTAYAFFEDGATYVDMDALKKAVKLTHYYGIFDIEFKYADGKAYFIEMNFRNGAPAYATTSRGFNIVGEWIFNYFDIDIKHKKKSDNEFLMCEHRDVINMLKGYVSFSSWFKNFIKANKLIWNWNDLKPSWIMYIGVIKTMFGRLFHGRTKKSDSSV